MGPKGDDGVVRVPDEDDCLAIAEVKGEVPHSEAGRLPPPVPVGNFVGGGGKGSPIMPGFPVLLNRLPIVWFLEGKYTFQDLKRFHSFEPLFLVTGTTTHLSHQRYHML